MVLRKASVATCILLSILMLSVSAADAGLAMRLEKEVPQSAVKGVNPITASIFASQTAASPVATQNFSVGELMVSILDTMSGAPMYRVRMDFTNTETLAMGMDLYWEFSLGGTMMGKREKVPQSAFALFAVQSMSSLTADTAATADTALTADTAVTVTGTVAEANIDEAIARDSEVVNIVNVSNLYYSAAEVDALLASLEGQVNTLQCGRKSWGPAANIGVNSAGTARGPKIAFDGNGNAMAVWSQGEAIRNIYANLYDLSAGWGTPVMISDGTHSASVPRVEFDGAGNAFVVWHQNDEPAVPVYAVYVNRYVAGSGWTGAALIGNAGRYERFPRLNVDNAGNAVVVWRSAPSLGGPYSIYANEYAAGSGSWGGPIQVTLSGISSSSFAGNDTGEAFLVYDRFDGVAVSAWAMKYSGLTLWGAAEKIEADDVGTVGTTEVTVDSAGNALAVWIQTAGGIGELWANYYDAGSGWGTPQDVGAQHPISNFDAAFGGAGDAMIGYIQPDAAYTDYHVMARRFTANAGLGPVTKIGSNLPHLERLNIKGYPYGDYAATWDYDNGTRFETRVNHYSAGLGWCSEAALVGATTNIRRSDMAFNPFGDAVFVWEQTWTPDVPWQEGAQTRTLKRP